MQFARRILTTVTLLAATAATAQAQTRPLNELFKQVSDAVVIILTAERTVSEEAPGHLVSAGGLGSGFLISYTGQVMTAAHVVQTADEVIVMFPSGERIKATVTGSDPAADLALLQLEHNPTGVVPLELGDSDLAQVGERVFIIGAPLGATHTLTVGHVSARRRPATTFAGLFRAELLQTDAAINQGNSGGPMFNMDGQVIGVVSHILSQSGGFEGLGFVVTTNVAREVLLSGRTIWTGVDGFWLNGDMAGLFNVPQEFGLLIQRVAMGSLAHGVGLRGGTSTITVGEQRLIVGGDILLAVNGTEVREEPEALEALWNDLTSLRPGSPVNFTVLRRGRVVDLTGTYIPPR